jgi:lipid-binding SYLF domain-containing protein
MRNLIAASNLVLLAALAAFNAGCSTTVASAGASASITNPDDNRAKTPAIVTRHADIDTAATEAIGRLHNNVKGSRDLMNRAAGVLVFPSVVAAGLGIGGEYGRGVLHVKGAPVGYYSIASVSIGLQAGAQTKTVALLFMTEDALTRFRNSNGWSAGADASVAVLKAGANGEIEVTPGAGPVVALVTTNAGLMANMTLEGTKITPLRK